MKTSFKDRKNNTNVFSLFKNVYLYFATWTAFKLFHKSQNYL